MNVWIIIAFLSGILLSVVISGFVGVYIFRQQRDRWIQKHEENLQRFLQRLDHELKNPVTAIRLALANLSITLDTLDQQQALQSINTQVLRINQLIKDLRKLADLNNIKIERIPVQINKLIEETITLIHEKSEIPRQRIICETVDTIDEVHVFGDKYLLLLAVYNMLDNAVKFTTDKDTITIRTSFYEGMLLIEVINTGPGIPPEDIPHVWEELYRSQNVRHIPGSGLGLPMIKAIVERHSGQVWLESSPDTGTTVSISLPVVET